MIPTKDRPNMLPRAIASVLDQASDAEIIVIDDGSSPENFAANRATCEPDPRITILRNETPGGAPAARNQGLAVSRGRYWATLDDDNVWMPGKWAAQRAVFVDAGFPEDLTVVCGVRFSHEPGATSAGIPAVRAPEMVSGTLGHLFERVSARCFVHSYVTSRVLMEQVGGYDPRLVWGEHTDLLVRLAEVSRFGGTPEVGVTVVKDHGAERTGRNWRRKVEGVSIILEKHAQTFAADPVMRVQYRHILGVSQLRAGDRKDAVRTFARLVRGGPGIGRRVRAFGHLCVAATGATWLWRALSKQGEGA